MENSENKGKLIKRARAKKTYITNKKLDDDTIRYIRNSKAGTRELSRILGVAVGTISNIRTGKSHTNVK